MKTLEELKERLTDCERKSKTVTEELAIIQAEIMIGMLEVQEDMLDCLRDIDEDTMWINRNTRG